MRITLIFKLIVVGVLILFLFIGIGSYRMNKAALKYHAALGNQRILENLGRQLASGSDYLTNEIRRYVQFGEEKHYQNFWREVKETKSREVLADLVALNVLPTEIEFIKKSKTYSDSLIEIEERAMEAVKKGDFNGARRLVFGAYYDSQKDLIMGNIKNFQNAVHLRTNKLVKDAQNEISYFMFVENVLLVTSGLLILYALLGITRKRIILPIKRLSESMVKVSKGDLNVKSPLSRRNDEINNLSSTFNQMIEDVKDTEEKLIAVQRQLQESEKLAAIGQLSAGVSHEILNPANIISLSTQMLNRKNKDDPEIQKFSEKVIHEIERIKKIIETILIFSREGNSKIEKGDLRDDIEKVLTLVEEEYKLESIKIVRNWCVDPVQISYDPDKIRQVFLNLLQNAKHAISNGGTITVSCKSTGNFIQVKVSDTGEGMPEEVRERVFEPFYTTKMEGEGTGMGLSVVYGIIKDHNGNITVQSEEGKGTTFIIDLPVAC